MDIKNSKETKIDYIYLEFPKKEEGKKEEGMVKIRRRNETLSY